MHTENDNISLRGKDLVRKYSAEAPELPGTYRFLDKEKQILYIGKAKSLRKRLAQYALELTPKNSVMLSLARHIEFNITNSESEALLLEAQLIKRFKPKYNIALKNDSSFPYIKLRIDHDYPQLIKFRGKNLVNGKFFGPFASVMHVDLALKEMQKIFKLRSCSDSFFASRTRPCLQYQINRCSGPCVGKISHQDYIDTVAEAKAFLSGKNSDLQKQLAEKMQLLSEQMKFEEAAEIRDKIKAISYVQLRSQKTHGVQDADLIGVVEKNGIFCVELFLYRDGTACGNQAYFPTNTSKNSSIEEVLGGFLMQLYQTKTPASHLLLSHDLEDKELYVKALSDLHNKKISISVPKQGSKQLLIQNALDNAEIALQNYLKNSAKNLAALEEIAQIFNLNDIPTRIEIYDNSHIQGAHAVGAMVVATQEGFDKKEYRIFNIKNQYEKPGFGGDDYAMLREVMQRRLKRVKAEPHRRPDLMIVDGGKGHLSTVEKVMEEMSISLPFVCMAKGRERNSGHEDFYMPGKPPFTLSNDLPVMRYLQILRDEVHNFAIKNHRSRRSKSITQSSIDDIPAIGQKRKLALLHYFGSQAAIADASISELSNVEGISQATAKRIYDYFRSC